MNEEEVPVNVGGRGNTTYTPESDEQAYNYCLLGATDAELAELFKVSANTIYKWKKKYPSFRESVKSGKVLADMQVARSLYKRALGYTFQQIISEAKSVPVSVKVGDVDSTFMDDSANGFQTIRVITREVIPDVKAQIFWLKNRQPEKWRDKQELDHKSGGEKLSTITIFELPNDGRND
ncbi:hypothetical protein [Emticicia fontis]